MFSPHSTTLYHRLVTVLVVAGVLVLFHSGITSTFAAGTNYFVDCASGNDDNNGTSADRAWRSVNRANSASLQPGDSLFLKRGCTWNQQLVARWVGTSSQPITVSAYGNGALPVLQNHPDQNVKISGSHLIIEYLRVRHDPIEVDAQCNNQPIGSYVGFDFLNGATHNELRHSEASHHLAGIRILAGSTHNYIHSNRITENNVMKLWNRGDPDNDLGAWGILINGNDNEIAYNYLADNNALCSYGSFRDGNSIELYMGQRNRIHHNSSFRDRVFSELGGNSQSRAADNTYAFNLHVSHAARARFLVVRGSANPFGPTWRTTALNNTVYLTHPTSQGVVCHAGCNTELLTVRNNILWADEKAIYSDGPIVESNNLFWRAGGNPVIQITGMSVSPSSRIADPHFAAAAQQDFQLRPGSPAVDRGSSMPLNQGFVTDIVHTPLPQGPAVDVGAYEMRDRSSYTNHIFVPLTRR